VRECVCECVCACAHARGGVRALGHLLSVSDARITNSDKNMPVSFAVPSRPSICPSVCPWKL
jgi:hypothetical protein